MASRGAASSARQLAVLHKSSSRGLALSRVSCLCHPAAAGAFSPHVAGIKRRPTIAPSGNWRSSSTDPKSSSSHLGPVGGSNAPVTSDADHLALAKPLDFDMASKVEGQESQMVTFELEPGQVIRAEAGNLVFMEDGIEMDTNTGGGAGSMFRRVITGQNMFVTDYVNRGGVNSKVGLGTDVPSKIVRLPLAAYGGAVICQRGAFLAGSHTIDIQTEFTNMMAGFFGGEGFVLQRLTGQGDAFVKASGPLVQRELKEGETLRVSSGSVVAFATSVQYDVQTIPGFKNVVFGGEGLFITKLTGPGTVFLQGLPFDRMVDQIARRIPGSSGAGMPIPVGVGGGGGGGGAEGEAEGGAEAVAGGDAAASTEAVGGETGGESVTNASSAGLEGGGSGTPGDLFGDAAPSTSTYGDSGSSGGASQQGFDEPDLGFSEPPPDMQASGETTWSESAFEADDAGAAADDGSGGGGEFGEGMGDDGEGGGGVVGTLKKIYTLFDDFGGGDDSGWGGGSDGGGE